MAWNPNRAKIAPTTLRAEIAEGVRWLAGNRLLRILAVAIALMNLTLSTTLSLSVLYAQERLGLGSVGAGGLLAARYGLTAPFWCSFAAMTVLTVTCWPILSARAIARARAQAPAGEDGP